VAKTSNLREFQEAILARLKEVATQGDTVSASRLGILVGGKRMLVNLNEVREVIPVPPMQVVPLTEPWFLGVANVRGNLYNISDLAQFLHLPPTARSTNNRILLLNSETTTQVAVMISGLVGLRSVDTMQLQPHRSENEVLYSKNVYLDTDNQEWLEMDFERLLQDKGFIQPTHVA
jgi:twitching motility protein PilI